MNLNRANETIPTITITKSDLLVMAAIKVGIDAIKYSISTFGNWPGWATNKLINHIVDIITIGTKDKKSTTICGNENFFNRKKGKTRESQVATPQPIIVKYI